MSKIIAHPQKTLPKSKTRESYTPSSVAATIILQFADGYIDGNSEIEKTTEMRELIRFFTFYHDSKIKRTQIRAFGQIKACLSPPSSSRGFFKMATKMVFLLIALVSAFILLSSTINAQKAGQCDLSEKRGLIVYFDISACDPTLRSGVEPRAIRYINKEPYQYAGLKEAPNTICISDAEFQANFYLDDGKQSSAVSSINVSKSANGVQAFYQTHSDDKAYHPGTRPHLPVIAPLANIRFADTPQNHPKISETSTASDVLTSSNPANALYIYYCSEV